ncbi:MAG: alanine:cation symporter family protein [Flavobacteriaceae bacterium]|nr:alanine:cation symporter family protein [Flavobacteriaceae bacterium]
MPGGTLVFYPIKFTEEVSMPMVIILLLFAGLLFTLLFKFANIRLFKTALNIVEGRYDKIDHVTALPMKDEIPFPNGDIPDTIRIEGHHGEVSHFQALTAALSGTVGLGNIAGVAIAISLGGPGATFWMILAGLLGMSSKFVECTLGVKYRDLGEDGTVYGGPMYYLKKGLAELGKGKIRQNSGRCFCLNVHWRLFWRWQYVSGKPGSTAVQYHDRK